LNVDRHAVANNAIDNPVDIQMSIIEKGYLLID